MKRMKTLVVIVSVLILITQSIVYAAPSDWAEVFIEEADEMNLIPNTLKSDYQSNIKRYEYILIALNVLEMNDITITLSNEMPFTDISGHAYEDEIIKAYSAGIISGYEDGEFKPDREITREEVAALVYNLVEKVNNAQVLPNTKTPFADDQAISEWARAYIEFNYQKEIMSGTGQVGLLDAISPQGLTTREQAITLLYKVAIDDTLLGKLGYENPRIALQGLNPGQVNTTAVTVGESVLDETLFITNYDDASISLIKDEYFTIRYDDATLIEVINDSRQKRLVVQFMDVDDDNIIDDAVTLGGVLLPGVNVQNIIDTYIEAYNEDNKFDAYDTENNLLKQAYYDEEEVYDLTVSITLLK